MKSGIARAFGVSREDVKWKPQAPSPEIEKAPVLQHPARWVIQDLWPPKRWMTARAASKTETFGMDPRPQVLKRKKGSSFEEPSCGSFRTCSRTNVVCIRSQSLKRSLEVSTPGSKS